MSEDAEYHEMREVAERAIASMLPESEARERHLDPADRHADKAWQIRNGDPDSPVDEPPNQSGSRKGADYSLAQATKRSQELVARSYRVLAESRRNIQTKG